MKNKRKITRRQTMGIAGGRRKPTNDRTGIEGQAIVACAKSLGGKSKFARRRGSGLWGRDTQKDKKNPARHPAMLR